MASCRVALLVVILATGGGIQFARAHQCGPSEFLYGGNEIVDELLTCFLSRSSDLDLTPHEDRVKPTARALVEQGFSNRTTSIHTQLSGLWTAKRPEFIESGWKCSDSGQITSTAIVEISSLSLEVIEKLDIQLHRNQHKLALHKPCKTFDIPVWMCRQSKPIYRTTTTWVNRAYFNLTLVQEPHSSRPTIEKLAPIFTCPETFKQKITHSPSASYVIARHLQQLTSQPSKPAYHSAAEPGQGPHPTNTINKPTNSRRRRQSLGAGSSAKLEADGRRGQDEQLPEISHPSSFTTLQSGKKPAAPPYHNSVRMIMGLVGDVLSSSLNDCIQLVDSDLSLMADRKSFARSKYSIEHDEGDDSHQADKGQMANAANECSNRAWIRSRIELASGASSSQTRDRSTANEEQPREDSTSPMKRNQFVKLDQSEPGDWSGDQLLDPHADYRQPPDALGQMIDDDQW